MLIENTWLLHWNPLLSETKRDMSNFKYLDVERDNVYEN